MTREEPQNIFAFLEPKPLRNLHMPGPTQNQRHCLFRTKHVMKYICLNCRSRFYRPEATVLEMCPKCGSKGFSTKTLKRIVFTKLAKEYALLRGLSQQQREDPVFRWVSMSFPLRVLCRISLLKEPIMPQNLCFNMESVRRYLKVLAVIRNSLSSHPNLEPFPPTHVRTLNRIVLLFQVFGRHVTPREIRDTLKISRSTSYRYYAAFIFLQEHL